MQSQKSYIYKFSNGREENPISSCFASVNYRAAISSIFIRGCYVLYSTHEFERSVEEMRSVVSNEKTVIHAAGTYKVGDAVYTYSNSKEAIENRYNSGNRIAELDFIWTNDGKLVCGHDEDDGWCYGIGSRSTLSEEFLNNKLFGITRWYYRG